jgi:hypothetical protein
MLDLLAEVGIRLSLQGLRVGLKHVTAYGDAYRSREFQDANLADLLWIALKADADKVGAPPHIPFEPFPVRNGSNVVVWAPLQENLDRDSYHSGLDPLTWLASVMDISYVELHTRLERWQRDWADAQRRK